MKAFTKPMLHIHKSAPCNQGSPGILAFPFSAYGGALPAGRPA